MSIFRSTPRAVYRVYSEDAYLTGAEDCGEWPALSPAMSVIPSSRARRLRRMAGAAALTGALGTVGGMIVLTGVGLRSAGRRTAANGAPRRRAIEGRVSGARRASAARRAGAERRIHAWRSRSVARRPVARGRSSDSGRLGSAAAARSAPGRRLATTVPENSVGRVGAGSAPGSSAPDASGEVAVVSTQSEFGFER